MKIQQIWWQLYFISHLFLLHCSPPVPLIPCRAVEAPCGSGTVVVSHSPRLHVGLPHVAIAVDCGGDIPVHHDPLLVVITLPDLTWNSIGNTFTSVRH